MDSIHKEWIDVVAHQPKFVRLKHPLWVVRGFFTKKIKAGTFLGHYMGRSGKKTTVVLMSFTRHETRKQYLLMRVTLNILTGLVT